MADLRRCPIDPSSIRVNRALRALANLLVGIRHGCLRHGTIYDEHTAWAHRDNHAA
jgi:hypothetical protein